MTKWTNDPGTTPPQADPDPLDQPTRVLQPAGAAGAAPPHPADPGRAGPANGGGSAPPPFAAPHAPAGAPSALPVAGLPFSPPESPPFSPPGAPPYPSSAAGAGAAAGGIQTPPPPAYPPLRQFPTGTGPVPSSGPGAGGPRRRLPLAIGAVALAVLFGAVALWVVQALRSDDGAPPASSRTGSDVTTSQPAVVPASASASTTPAAGGATAAPEGPRTDAPQLDPTLAAEPAAAVNKAVSPAVVQIETSFGLGTGFIYDGQGYILTAAHVVANTDSAGAASNAGFERDVTVRLADGSSVAGTVLGADLNNDVAVVKIDPVPDMPVAALALGDEPEVGSIAIAIGSPFGLDQTVTQGIVSAVNRPVSSPNQNIVSMIQTDAAINSGNSGGPLVNREGKVIGINTQIRTDSGDNAGIGFAVPIDLAYEVAQHLVAGEPIRLGYLGVRGGDPGFGSAGALVVRVEANSPAAQAGIAEGDVVTEANGTAIRSFEELASIIRATQPGEKLELSVERDGRTQQITVTVGEATTN